MSMELWWNESDRRKPKNSGKKNLCERHILHNKSHMKWPWIVPWRPPWQVREISISTVGLCNENQTQVLQTTHQAWWLLNRDRDPKILYIKQYVQLAQALNLVHSLSMAQIQCVPFATEPGISLIILPLMRILQRNLKRTIDTFIFISHTTNVLHFKFRCHIFTGFRIIKEMPGSVASGTPDITHDATYFTGTNSTQLVSEQTPDFCRRIKCTSRIAGYCYTHRFIN